MKKDLYVVEFGYFEDNNYEYRKGQYEFLTKDQAINFIHKLTTTDTYWQHIQYDNYIELFVEHDWDLTEEQLFELLEYDDFNDFELGNCEQLCSIRLCKNKGE